MPHSHRLVRLLVGTTNEQQTNANNKFMDDYKTSISFEGKNETEIEYKKGFLGMFVKIAAKY